VSNSHNGGLAAIGIAVAGAAFATIAVDNGCDDGVLVGCNT
jgi:hypothetical protein